MPEFLLERFGYCSSLLCDSCLDLSLSRFPFFWLVISFLRIVVKHGSELVVLGGVCDNADFAPLAVPHDRLRPENLDILRAALVSVRRRNEFVGTARKSRLIWIWSSNVRTSNALFLLSDSVILFKAW